MPRRKAAPAAAPPEETQMDTKKRTRESKKTVDTDTISNVADNTSSSDSEPPTKKRKSAKTGGKTGTNKKPKTKEKLRREGIMARKELKQKDVEIQELKKALQEKTLECEQEQLPKHKLATQNMEVSQSESKDLLDDTVVRKGLRSLFSECSNFTADWARGGSMSKILSKEQIILTIKAVKKFPHLKCDFLSNAALEIVVYIPNGARLLLESLLNHIVVDRVFAQPLTSIKRTINGKDNFTYAYALERFTREIRHRESR